MTNISKRRFKKKGTSIKKPKQEQVIFKFKGLNELINKITFNLKKGIKEIKETKGESSI